MGSQERGQGVGAADAATSPRARWGETLPPQLGSLQFHRATPTVQNLHRLPPPHRGPGREGSSSRLLGL